MTFHDFIAGSDDNGRRADRIVRRFIPASGLSGLYGAFRKGLIKINGKKASPNKKIYSGDTIGIAALLLQNQTSAPIDAQDSPSAAPPFPFPVVFRNRHVLIINKPYNICVHGSAGAIECAVKQLYRTEAQRMQSLAFAPGPLHRLDRRTSGLLIFSWSIEGAHYLSGAFADGSIKKTYLSLVEGELKTAARWEDRLIAKHSNTPHAFQTMQVTSSPIASAKHAITEATPLAYGVLHSRPCTLVRFELGTGRKHQIRVQSAFHGFPLLGDSAYGAAVIEGSRQLYLHAHTLLFRENPIALPARIRAPLPPAFASRLLEAGILFHDEP